MRKRLISLMIVMMLCFTFVGNTLALDSEDSNVQLRSTAIVTCGLAQSGSQYRLWSRIKISYSDDLTTSASLYRIVNGREVFVTSVSASGKGTTLTASKLRTLASGTYKVYGSGTSGSSSSSNSSTITVP